MSLKDTLKKANIIRAGAVAGTYKSAKDRPMALQDDMFIGKDKPTNFKKSKNNKPPNRPTRNLLIACALLALLFIWLSLTTTITWALIVLWLLLLTYFWLLFIGKFVFKFNITLSMLLIIFSISSFLLVLITQSKSNSNTSDSNSSYALNTEQCKPYYDKYNGKIYKINSDGLEGTIAIKIDSSAGCKLLGWYNVILSYNLPTNNYSRDIGTPAYNYIVLLRPNETDSRTKYNGFGALMGAYKNVTQLPDIYAEGKERSQLYSDGAPRVETRYFYWGYKIETNFSEERYQQIFDDTTMQIVDGLAYIEEELGADGGYSWGINYDKAAEVGSIVKTYQLTIEEQ